MSISNRDENISGQKDWFDWSSGGGQGGVTFSQGYVPTGVTLAVAGPIPYPYILQSFSALAVGASGAPQLAFSIGRVIGGGGFTMIACGISNMVIANSASFQAVSGYSGLAPVGSTLLLGLRGDVLFATTQGANTACNLLVINGVIEKVQDLVSYNGISN